MRGNAVRFISPDELASAKFLLYPQRSNMRAMIQRFFEELNIGPQVIMEADDTEVIKKLVESGFGYSILPESALHGRPLFPDLSRAGSQTQSQAGASDDEIRISARAHIIGCASSAIGTGYTCSNFGSNR